MSDTRLVAGAAEIDLQAIVEAYSARCPERPITCQYRPQSGPSNSFKKWTFQTPGARPHAAARRSVRPGDKALASSITYLRSFGCETDKRDVEASVALSATVRRTVERLLSERYGADVRIAGVEAFPHYPQVARCALEAAGRAAPATVIVRLARNPQDDPARSGVAWLRNEQAALEFLRSIGSTLAPRCIAGDAATGVLVTEDLGMHPSLLDLLLGRDETAARQGLLAFACGLGTLHTQTAGRASAYQERRTRLGPPDLQLRPEDREQ